MDNYESPEDEKHWKAFSTPDERKEYKRELRKEARAIASLPLSAREAHYERAEAEYGKEHLRKLVSEVKKQRERLRGMEM